MDLYVSFIPPPPLAANFLVTFFLFCFFSFLFYCSLEAYCDSVLGLCVAVDQWESVLEILDIMKGQGLTQERSSYRACLQACFEAGNGASAKDILNAMEKALVKPEPPDIALTVAAFCRRTSNTENAPRQGLWRKALGLLKTTSVKVESPDDAVPAEAYNAVLECMVEERQWKEAVRLLRLMEEGSSPNLQEEKRQLIGYHPVPDISTYREVIECCVGGNQAEQAVQVLYSMKDQGVKVRLDVPTKHVFVCREVSQTITISNTFICSANDLCV